MTVGLHHFADDMPDEPCNKSYDHLNDHNDEPQDAHHQVEYHLLISERIAEKHSSLSSTQGQNFTPGRKIHVKAVRVFISNKYKTFVSNDFFPG